MQAYCCVPSRSAQRRILLTYNELLGGRKRHELESLAWQRGGFSGAAVHPGGASVEDASAFGLSHALGDVLEWHVVNNGKMYGYLSVKPLPGPRNASPPLMGWCARVCGIIC